MSLILEALRKSESERQMGQPPGLMSQAAQMSGPRQANRALLWALAAALVLAIALGAWWLGRQAQPPAPPATEAAPTEEAAATRPAELKPAEPSVPAAGEPTPEPLVLGPAPKPLVLGPAPTSTAPTASVPLPTATDTPKPEPTPAEQDKVAEPISRPDIRLMPSSERNQLPPLKLSVHVYHEDASRRFAIIDGRRVVDGESLDGGVQVKAIERDGLWLVINGRSWWLPR